MKHGFGKNNTVGHLELIVTFYSYSFNKLLGVFLKLTESKGHLVPQSCKEAYKQSLCIGVGRLSFREALQGVPQEATSRSAVFTAV